MAAVLNGWKEISGYLRVGLRTAQRWEKNLALPVYRTGTSERGPVLAYSSELDGWLHRQTDSPEVLAHYENEKRREDVLKLRVLRTQMRQLMQTQKLLVSRLSATRTQVSKKNQRSLKAAAASS